MIWRVWKNLPEIMRMCAIVQCECLRMGCCLRLSMPIIIWGTLGQTQQCSSSVPGRYSIKLWKEANQVCCMFVGSAIPSWDTWQAILQEISRNLNIILQDLKHLHDHMSKSKKCTDLCIRLYRMSSVWFL